ncbi:hypothetical protein Cob_v001818 [Colletotrichum orbiculare MAFF 240422]|uniref:Uncharacterized protein n=1 Tax=Colletotrichum orbiculare (strain 104-T / ATCC 96160 / CBS 514.97 / LARS 414 / MAFF 240422) TaxID=1213857 RepID=A0A484G5M9_COLOR|nr:hypothetical protein Cob_v001818 [Colletotrichum orbiculare MAFF 240422]
MAEVFGVVASSLVVAELTAKFGVSMLISQLVLICQQTHAVTQQSHMIALIQCLSLSRLSEVSPKTRTSEVCAGNSPASMVNVFNGRGLRVQIMHRSFDCITARPHPQRKNAVPYHHGNHFSRYGHCTNNTIFSYQGIAMKVNLLVLAFVLASTGVDAGSCIAEPIDTLDMRYGDSFISWAQQTCLRFGATPTGDRQPLNQTCGFKGEVAPAGLQRVWHPLLTGKGIPNMTFRTKWTCRKV